MINPFKQLRILNTRFQYHDDVLAHMMQKNLETSREMDRMYQKVNVYETIKYDMVKIDAVVAMVSELARRLDLANVPDLPNTCVCESCGCKK